MSEVPGRGNPKARGLILGEAPGAEEERLGRPFIGPSGRLLSEALAEEGLSEVGDVWITNVIKTRPPDNRTPTRHEIAGVLEDLDAEVNAVNPEAILALGNVPLFALTGIEGGITRRHGIWEMATLVGVGIPVLPCVHPAYVLRDRRKWLDSFRRAIHEFTNQLYPG